MITVGATVAVVIMDHGSIDCISYRDLLAAVLDTMERASIGQGTGFKSFGDAQHIDALNQIEQKLADVRDKIQSFNSDE